MPTNMLDPSNLYHNGPVSQPEFCTDKVHKFGLGQQNTPGVFPCMFPPRPIFDFNKIIHKSCSKPLVHEWPASHGLMWPMRKISVICLLCLGNLRFERWIFRGVDFLGVSKQK